MKNITIPILITLCSCTIANKDSRVFIVAVEYNDNKIDTLRVHVPNRRHKPELNESGCLDVYYYGTIACQVKKATVLSQKNSQGTIFVFNEYKNIN